MESGHHSELRELGNQGGQGDKNSRGIDAERREMHSERESSINLHRVSYL